jgi:hypothetical protein
MVKTLDRPDVSFEEACVAGKNPLTERQAVRLADIASLNVASIKPYIGKPIAEVAEKLKYQIDFTFFRFIKVCGRVVKKDPLDGTLLPVPFATVHIEDTDTSFLGFFPTNHSWSWLFPLFSRRETLAQVKTDGCGRFCAYIPRFDIDYILRFRQERHCFPVLFKKPSIRDLIEELRYPLPRLSEAYKGQDMPEIPRHFASDRYIQLDAPVIQREQKLNGMKQRRLQELLGEQKATRLMALEAQSSGLGASTTQLQAFLDEPAYQDQVPPPLPSRLPQGIREQIKRAFGQRDKDSLLTTENLNLDSKALRLQPQRFIGPFLRCVDVLVPEWQTILDVPDITFKVTQDVNGDAIEETIYSESFFDVRWNSGNIPDVTLIAKPNAIASYSCAYVPPVSTDIGLHLIGAMKLGTVTGGDQYHNNTSGYALRTNRPHSSGLYGDYAVSDMDTDPDDDGINDGQARTPFCGILQLYGRNNPPGAAYYRVRYEYTAPGTLTPTLPQSFMESWNVIRNSAPYNTRLVAPDTNGWYEILSNPADWYFGDVLLNWHSGATGLYRAYLEFADSGKNLMPGIANPAANIYVDNERPGIQFQQLRWKYSDESTYGPAMELICPVIRRQANRAIDVQVTYQSWANHLRSVMVAGNGCGGANTLVRKQPASIPAVGSPAYTAWLSQYEHWHSHPSDNNVLQVAEFTLSEAALSGAYGISISSESRSFNPAMAYGADDSDYYTDNQSPLYSTAHLPIAIVNS